MCVRQWIKTQHLHPELVNYVFHAYEHNILNCNKRYPRHPVPYELTPALGTLFRQHLSDVLYLGHHPIRCLSKWIKKVLQSIQGNNKPECQVGT